MCYLNNYLVSSIFVTYKTCWELQLKLKLLKRAYLNKNILAESSDGGLYEFVKELIVLAALDAGVPQPDVEGVFEEGLVVSTDIQRDGQALVGFDPGQGRVQSQLPNRNAHSASAEVSQTQDPFTVGHANGTHVRFRPAPK